MVGLLNNGYESDETLVFVTCSASFIVTSLHQNCLDTSQTSVDISLCLLFPMSDVQDQSIANIWRLAVMIAMGAAIVITEKIGTGWSFDPFHLSFVSNQ